MTLPHGDQQVNSSWSFHLARRNIELVAECIVGFGVRKISLPGNDISTIAFNNMNLVVVLLDRHLVDLMLHLNDFTTHSFNFKMNFSNTLQLLFPVSVINNIVVYAAVIHEGTISPLDSSNKHCREQDRRQLSELS